MKQTFRECYNQMMGALRAHEVNQAVFVELVDKMIAMFDDPDPEKQKRAVLACFPVAERLGDAIDWIDQGKSLAARSIYLSTLVDEDDRPTPDEWQTLIARLSEQRTVYENNVTRLVERMLPAGPQ